MKRKRTKPPSKPPKGSAWLPPEYQGRRYKVSCVIVKPRITILADDGAEEREIFTNEVGWYRSAWGKSLAEFLRATGLEIAEPSK